MLVINNRSYKFFVLLLIFFFVSSIINFSFSQDVPKDSTQNSLVKKHSPRIATLCSTVIPGLGQVYNKKFWKVPVIYVGLGTLCYFFYQNNKDYQLFKETALQKGTIWVPGGIITGTDLIYYRDKFRRYRDLNMIGIIVLYVLNIVDANVDANLYDFDVSDKLSLRIEPAMMNLTQNLNTVGFKCQIKF